VLRRALGRACDLVQLGLGATVATRALDWLERRDPTLRERARHEPFAAAGKAFVREVGALEKGVFLAKMLVTDGARTGSRSPRAAPRTAGKEVLFGGDVLFPGVMDDATFSPGLRARLATADAVIVNLEATLADSPGELAPLQTVRGLRQLSSYAGDPGDPGWASRLDPEAARVLVRCARRLGVTVANNHALDDGIEGFGRTVDRARSLGMLVVGDAREGDGSAILELGAARVGLFAVGYGSNRQEPASPYRRFEQVPYVLDERATRTLVEGLRSRGATHVVACLHWGHESEHEPSAHQRACVRRLLSLGVTAVAGHHPHLLQTTDVHDGHWAAYSLGDLVGGDRTIWSRFAALLSLRFHDDGGVSGELVPVVQTPFWTRQSTMLLGEAPWLERAVYETFFAWKEPA
jgi:hypothetical protein